MVTTQLITYIREQQAIGRDEDTIMETLLSRQWKPQDIRAGFESIGAWNRTFQYVIPGDQPKVEAKDEPQSVTEESEPAAAEAANPMSKQTSKLGMAVFVAMALVAAAVAFSVGRNAGTSAPATIPAQSTASNSNAPASHPPVTLPAANPDVNF